MPNRVSNWLQGEVAQFLMQKANVGRNQLTPENLVEMIAIIEDGTISSKIAKKALFTWRKTVVAHVNT